MSTVTKKPAKAEQQYVFRHAEKEGVLYIHWDSISALVEHARAFQESGRASSKELRCLHFSLDPTYTGMKRDWFGIGRSAADAVQVVQNGWHTGAQRMAQDAATISRELQLDLSSQQVVTRRRKRRNGDSGDSLDIHKVYMGGLDKAWQRAVKQPNLSHSTRHVTFFLDVAGLQTVEHDDTRWRAALMFLLCDTAIRMGYHVRLLVGSTTTGWASGYHSLKLVTSFLVKDYNQPLESERLAAYCTLGFHRTINFAARAINNGVYQCRTDMGWTDKTSFDPLPMHNDPSMCFRISNSLLSLPAAKAKLKEILAIMSKGDAQ